MLSTLGLSYFQTVKNWAKQFCKEIKKQRAKNQVQEYKTILLTMDSILNV